MALGFISDLVTRTACECSFLCRSYGKGNRGNECDSDREIFKRVRWDMESINGAARCIVKDGLEFGYVFYTVNMFL